MLRPAQPRPSHFAVALACFCAVSTVAADEIIHGEQLDPSTYGPGIVESMADALARDRIARQAEPVASQDKHGRWAVPSRRSTYYPHAGNHNLVNKYGDTRMGIGFPAIVDVRGAYFAAQGAEGTWAKAVRVIGYRDGEEVARSGWFSQITEEPAWLAMDLRGVDRIEILAVPAVDGAGFYGLDDLTFVQQGRTIVLDFEDARYNSILTDTDYAGLTWETGRGSLDPDLVPAPQTIPAPEIIETSPDSAGDADVVEPRASRAAPPVLTRDFQGVMRGDAASNSAPPDTHGAVGPNHYVITVNRVFAVYDKDTGSELMSMNLSSFHPGSSGDPRVLFDQHSGRWVVVISNFSSRIYLAVSTTDDPTGDWFKTSVLISQGSDSSCWPDYPTLGVDEHGIYTASYMVGCGMTILAIDKAPLIDPSPSLGTVTAYRGLTWEGAIQPVHTYGSPGGEFLVSRTSSTSLRIRRIDPPMTSPTLVEVGFVTIPPHDFPPDAPALGCNTDLDTVDYRPMNAVYRDGSLWTTHCIGYNGRAAARWYEVDPFTADLTQVGTVADSSLYYFFPAIAVNQFGRVILGFSGSNADQFVSTYYAGRVPSDPDGEMSSPTIYHAGQAGQDIIDGYGRNRFGDYSNTTLDPVDELTIYTLQEYVEADNVWATWVGVFASADCNGNLVDDYQDIIEGTSEDCNANVVPDECEPDEDCNANTVQDICDIAGATSADCNANTVPDECDIASGTSADDNANEVPDECEVTRLYVDEASTGLEQGTTWANAYTGIDDALAVADLPGSLVNEIWVAEGAYLPTKQTASNPRSATFQLIDGVELLGGFAGDETLEEQRDPAAHPTTLSGDLGDNDGGGLYDENAFHVVSAIEVGPTAVIDGFIITAGRADAGAEPNDRGAGMLSDDAAPTIHNCLFQGNHASVRGGGVMAKDVSAPTISACVFQNNSTDTRGGAFYNSATSTSIVVNCLFIDNSAADGGALASNGAPTCVNCTFGNNTATGNGGGIYNFKGTSILTAANCVFWGNSDAGGTDESAQIHMTNGTLVLTNSCLQGWSTPGVDGNINTDPQFADADLRLSEGSDCIDAGDNASVPPGFITDLDGHLRFRDGNGDDIAIVDMGAYEFAPLTAGCVCGDINGSGGPVDLNDFGAFALCYGATSPSPGCDEETFACSDLNASGTVNLSDFSTFAVLFGVTSTKEVPDCLE